MFWARSPSSPSNKAEDRRVSGRADQSKPIGIDTRRPGRPGPEGEQIRGDQCDGQKLQRGELCTSQLHHCSALGVHPNVGRGCRGCDRAGFEGVLLTRRTHEFKFGGSPRYFAPRDEPAARCCIATRIACPSKPVAANSGFTFLGLSLVLKFSPTKYRLVGSVATFLPLPAPRDSATMMSRGDEGLRGVAGRRNGRAFLTLQEACMPLNVRKIAALELAAFLIFTTRLLAGDRLQPADGYAPPERFSAEQRGHWAYQAGEAGRTAGGQGIDAGCRTRSIGSSSPSSKSSV